VEARSTIARFPDVLFALVFPWFAHLVLGVRDSVPWVLVLPVFALGGYVWGAFMWKVMEAKYTAFTGEDARP
jgi:hypothetical protein